METGMVILDRIESRERCAEAGWFAYDYRLDKPMEKQFIVLLRPLGSFVYLQMLKKPFFKIETDHFLIKGIENDNFFRMAVHGDYLGELDQVEKFITELEFISNKEGASI